MQSNEPSFPVFDAHRAQLLNAFIERLMREEPASVLDVGAGGGALVAALSERGVDALGIESSSRALTWAQSAGRRVVDGSADALPHDANSFDWVTLRHVLHHLEAPIVAVREALRVARRGVLLAEPTTTTGLPGHAGMTDLDLLLRRLDRTNGHWHQPNISVLQLTRWVPHHYKLELSELAPGTRLPGAEVESLVAKSAERMVFGDHDRGEVARLVRLAGDQDGPGIVAPGTAMLMAWSVE